MPKGAKPAAAPSKKAEQKAKERIIEDRTFGLKNKNKSRKVQDYVRGVTQRVQQAGRKGPPPPTEAQKRKEEKKKEEEAKREVAQLMRPVITQKVPPGVDPKSIVCEYWKRGACDKGDKCKFAHDYNAGRRQKIDLYTDRRDAEAASATTGAAGVPAAAETMEDWDQQTLERSVEQRFSERNRANQTSIICKYFLEALEQRKYGWFWQCPNGDSCIYRHALPPGYVLVKKEPRVLHEDEDPDQPTLEEQIEAERMKVRSGEQVTAESFARWKKAKQERKAAEEKKKDEETRAAVQQGRNVLLSGRQLLIYKPTVFVDDEEATELERMTEQEYDEMLNASAAAAAGAAPSEGTAPSEDADADAAADATAAVEDASLFVDDEEEEEETDAAAAAAAEDGGAAEEGDEQDDEEEEGDGEATTEDAAEAPPASVTSS